MLDTKILLPAILAVILFMVPQVEASQISDAVSPEIRVALDTKANGQPVTAKNWMVAAANPMLVRSTATAATVLDHHISYRRPDDMIQSILLSRRCVPHTYGCGWR